ncbi:MAG: hypothetical protein KDD89_08555 [Anaerolineales bacterium]|nr:hypothetical protein [Anaerolineales bacterium]
MKKWHIFMLMMVLSLLFVACGDEDMMDEPLASADTALVGDSCTAEDMDSDTCAYVSGDEEDGPEELCFPGELYDAETDECYIECDTDEECDALEALIYGEEDTLDNGRDNVGPSQDENPCYPGELYDPDTDECYIECDTEEECLALEEEIYGEFDDFWEDDLSSDAFGEPDEETPSLAVYDIGQDFELTLVAGDPAADVEPIYLDPEWHAEIWDFTHRLLPNDVLQAEIVQFVIFTDGVEETLAYVSPLDENPEKWLVAIDIADVEAAGSLVNPDFVHTLVHEFAHVLSLENDQVPPDYEAIELANEGSDEYSEVAESCQTFYTGEGCSLPESYINAFFFDYWEPIYDDLPEDPDDADGLADFYDQYADQFVTDYAATNPGEDIAESFTFFVLRDKPQDNSVASAKVNFFYNYPRLVQMRQEIRGSLARLQGGN